MATISLNIDRLKGMTFLDNKLSIKTSIAEKSLLEKRSNGLFVPSLKGNKGPNGGSACDNHTIEEVGGWPQVNRDNVVLIYSMQTKNNINEVVTECNKGNASTPYLLHTNDLFMFRDIKHATPILNNGDDGNRYPGDTAKALFVVTRVANNSSRNVTSLTLKCLWSAVSGWVNGSSYTY